MTRATFILRETVTLTFRINDTMSYLSFFSYVTISLTQNATVALYTCHESHSIAGKCVLFAFCNIFFSCNFAFF